MNGEFSYNPAHAIGTCGTCGAEMAYNVPRLGSNGGYIHKTTGRFECGGVAAPSASEPVEVRCSEMGRCRDPRCRCGNPCAYYGVVGGYSNGCVDCNKHHASQTRESRRRKKASTNGGSEAHLAAVKSQPEEI